MITVIAEPSNNNDDNYRVNCCVTLNAGHSIINMVADNSGHYKKTIMILSKTGTVITARNHNQSHGINDDDDDFQNSSKKRY